MRRLAHTTMPRRKTTGRVALRSSPAKELMARRWAERLWTIAQHAARFARMCLHSVRLPRLPSLRRPSAKPIKPFHQRTAKYPSRAARHRWRGAFALAAIGCALLATAGVSARDPISMASAPPTAPKPTATPWPTPTPTPLPPPPMSVPPGWQVYRAHHFAVAYPLGWEPIEHVVQNWDGSIVEVSVSFNSADGAYSVGIAERERLDYDALNAFCATPGSKMTYAGLPMITSRTAATLRMYVFVSAGGVAYTLLYREDAAAPQPPDLYDTILGTFRPEVATPACT